MGVLFITIIVQVPSDLVYIMIQVFLYIPLHLMVEIPFEKQNIHTQMHS